MDGFRRDARGGAGGDGDDEEQARGRPSRYATSEGATWRRRIVVQGRLDEAETLFLEVMEAPQKQARGGPSFHANQHGQPAKADALGTRARWDEARGYRCK